MRSVMAAVCAAIVLSGTAAMAQGVIVDDQRGRFARYDANSQVIVLDDGRMYRVVPNTLLLVDSRPVSYAALQPGQVIVIRGAQPVVYQGGHYAAVGPSGAPEAPPSTTTGSTSVIVTPPASTTVVPPPPPPAATVVTPGVTVVTPGPTASVVTPAPSSLRRTFYGTVTDVDRNEIRIRTDRGSFEVPLANAKNSGIRKGDTVQLDMMVTTGAPAALPR